MYFVERLVVGLMQQLAVLVQCHWRFPFSTRRWTVVWTDFAISPRPLFTLLTESAEAHRLVGATYHYPHHQRDARAPLRWWGFRALLHSTWRLTSCSRRRSISFLAIVPPTFSNTREPLPIETLLRQCDLQHFLSFNPHGWQGASLHEIVSNNPQEWFCRESSTDVLRGESHLVGR